MEGLMTLWYMCVGCDIFWGGIRVTSSQVTGTPARAVTYNSFSREELNL